MRATTGGGGKKPPKRHATPPRPRADVMTPAERRSAARQINKDTADYYAAVARHRASFKYKPGPSKAKQQRMAHDNRKISTGFDKGTHWGPYEQALARYEAQFHAPRTVRELGRRSAQVATGIDPEHPLSQGPYWLAANAATVLPLGRFLRGLKDLSALEHVPRRVPKYPEHMPPEVQASAKKLTAALSLGGAKKARAAQDVAVSEERAKRLSAAGEAMKQNPGIKGFYKGKHEMRGPMPKPHFPALVGKLGDKEVEDLFTYVSNHPTLREGDKLTTHRGLEKAFHGEVPTQAERALIYKTFGPEFGKALDKARPRLAKAKELGLEVVNIPRSFMASADVSAPFRQGLVAGARHPVMFSKNLPSMLHQFGSEEFHQQVMRGIHKDPLYQDALDHGLSLTELGPVPHLREEQFPSSLAEKITGGQYGPVRASGRAYLGFLDKVRMDMYTRHIEGAEKFYGGELNAKQKRAITNFINKATGRGSLAGRLQDSAALLNTVFFSPRLLASRVGLLNDVLNPVRAAKMDPYVRRQTYRSMIGLVGFVGSILELAHLAGAHVEMDPRNADWAKIRIGNTRIDLLGGFQQPIRLFAQEISGRVISSTTGDTLTLGPGLGNMSRKDILERFFRGKLAPVPSVGYDVLAGSDFQGQPLSVKKEIASHLVPLSVQDAQNLHHDTGNIPATIGGYALGATGVGVQTYGPKDKTKKAKENNDKLTQAFQQNVQQYFHRDLTPQIKRALRLRVARDVYFAKNLDKNSTPLEKYNAQVDLMLSRKMIRPEQARKAKAWAKHQDPHRLKSRTASLGHKYFGGDVLSSAAKKIRDRGGHFYLDDF